MSSSHHPQSDASNERLHAFLEDILRCTCSNTTPLDWEDLLPLTEFTINNTVSATTGFSPFFLNNLTVPLTPQDLVVNIPEVAPPSVATFLRQNESVYNQAITNIAKAHERQRLHYNSSHQPKQFALGQKVLLKTEFLTWTGLTEAGRHFKQPYIGPFTICKVISKGRAYELDFGSLDIRIHPVQPLSRLELYNDSAQEPLPLPMDVTEAGQELFEISHIVSSKVVRGIKQYLVRYQGYGPEYDMWINADELVDAEEMIAQYEQ